MTATQELNRPQVLLDLVASSKIDPINDRTLVIAVAEASLQLGKHREIIALLDRWLITPKGTTDADAHAIIGISLGSVGRASKALSHFQEALRLAPNHPVAMRNIDIARAATMKQKP